jgi:hypothetical protein
MALGFRQSLENQNGVLESKSAPELSPFPICKKEAMGPQVFQSKPILFVGVEVGPLGRQQYLLFI